MDKQFLVNLVESYHLNGLVESVVININDKLISVNFITETKDTLGFVKIHNDDLQLENCKIGIFNTSELLKLLKITDDNINLSLEKEQGTLVKLNISDSNYDLSYHLSELAIIPVSPNINEPENYEYEIELNSSFIEDFISAYNALSKVGRCTFQAKETKKQKVVEVVLGESGKQSHKIKFQKPSNFNNEGLAIPFPSLVLKEIFNVNKNRIGKMQINEKGLAKITFGENNLNVVYFLVRMM